MGVAALLRVFDSLSVFCVATTIIRLLVFVPSVSENISCVGFLKPKTAENRNWHFGILSIC
jgi:hypothetical protein